MKKDIPNLLREENLISQKQHEFIKAWENDPAFSIYWELRIFLYLGITLLSSGFGILVYENIDTIGHQTILALIALLCALCFWYCFKHRQPFAYSYVKSPTAIFDYVLLLGCLLLLTFEGYIQYQYNFFGEKYGLATIIPTFLFFLLSYYFDHRGVLGMAISGLALWLGIALTPSDIFKTNDFNNINIVTSGIGLGIVLCIAAWRSVEESFKKHFEFTYLNFGAHLVFISSIIGMITFGYQWIFILIIISAVACFILYAKRKQSFYYLLVSTFYAYFSITYLFLIAVEDFHISIEAILLYFILSCAGIIFFFLNYKKFLNSNP